MIADTTNTIRKPIQVGESDNLKIGVSRSSAIAAFARDYPTVHAMIAEGIQNSTDAGAQRILVKIDYSRPAGQKCIAIMDDGSGVNPDELRKAVSNLGVTLKKGKGKFGRFGEGLTSPWDKARQVLLTSNHEEDDSHFFREWTFDCESILAGKEDVGCQSNESYYHTPDPNRVLPQKYRKRERVWWRTRMAIIGVTEDRTINKIDLSKLCADVASSYKDAILARNIDVKISYKDKSGKREVEGDVVPKRCAGKALPLFSETTKDAGQIDFQLHLALNMRTGRKGKVLFYGLEGDAMPQPIDAGAFQFSVNLQNRGGLPIDSNALKALCSGVFEGEVRAEHVKLHPNRSSFECNDALVDLCGSIEEWYRRVGSSYMQSVLEEEEDKRFELAVKATLPFLERFFNDANWEIPESFLVEKRKHKHSLREKPESEQPQTQKPKKDVRNPNSRKRAEAKGKGFAIEVVQLETSGQIYSTEDGIIQINSQNPLCVACQGRQATLNQYIFTVVSHAVLQLQYGVANGTREDLLMRELLKSQVMVFVNPSPLSGKSEVYREINFNV